MQWQSCFHVVTLSGSSAVFGCHLQQMCAFVMFNTRHLLKLGMGLNTTNLILSSTQKSTKQMFLGTINIVKKHEKCDPSLIYIHLVEWHKNTWKVFRNFQVFYKSSYHSKYKKIENTCAFLYLRVYFFYFMQALKWIFKFHVRILFFSKFISNIPLLPNILFCSILLILTLLFSYEFWG